MPPEIYGEMWRCIQRKEPWSGYVKNRRKDGGFYWVFARVIPVIEEGVHTGYASVRVKASNDAIRRAQNQYDQINARGANLNAKQRVMQATPKVAGKGLQRLRQLLRTPFSKTLLGQATRLGLLGIAVNGIAMLGLSNEHVNALLPNNGWISILAVGSAAVLLYGRQIMRQISTAIQQATYVSQQISTGNLQVQMPTLKHSEHEISQLYFFLDFMRGSLGDLAATPRSRQ